MRVLRGANGAVINVAATIYDVGVTITECGASSTIRLDRSGALALRDAIDAIIGQADRRVVCDVRFETGTALAAPSVTGRATHRRCAQHRTS